MDAAITHISTGLSQHKFGIDIAEAAAYPPLAPVPQSDGEA
jgi:hypothetical protein